MNQLASLEHLTPPNGNISIFLVKYGKLRILHLVKSAKIKMSYIYTAVLMYGNLVILNKTTKVKLSILQMILISQYAQMEDVYHTLVLILSLHLIIIISLLVTLLTMVFQSNKTLKSQNWMVLLTYFH